MTGIEIPKAEMAVPGSAEHRRLVTASKVPAMMRDGDQTSPTFGDYLGIGYTDAYTLWHEMAGQFTPNLPDEKILARGHWMEPAAREFWRWSNPGWRVSPGEVAFTDPDLPFPNQVTLDLRASRGRARRIIEVKSPRKDEGVHDKWLVQVQMQMGVSGIHEADLVLMPQWGEERIEHITFDPDLYAAIVEDAAHFWGLLQAGTPPDAGGSENAKDILAALHPRPTTEVLDLGMDVMDQWTTAIAAEAAAARALTAVENRIREQMGDAGKACFEGSVVASRTAGRFAKTRLPKTDEATAAIAACTVDKPTLDTKKLKTDFPDLYAEGVAAPAFTFNRKAWS